MTTPPNLQFSKWLNQELLLRGWNPADLARHEGISQGQVSNILNAKRNAGPNTCRAIAHALGYSEEYVFRRAGLLSPENPNITEEKEAVHLLRQLSPSRRRAAIDMLRGLSSHSFYPPQKEVNELDTIITEILDLLVRQATPNQLATGARWFSEARAQYLAKQREERPQNNRGENGTSVPIDNMDGELSDMS